MTGVRAEYHRGQPILNGLSLTARRGEITVILGPNGSGKSTVLKVLAGLLRPSAGTVELVTGAGTADISRVPAHERPGRKIAYLPQGHSVFPSLSVHDNLMLGAWPVRRNRKAAAQAVAAVYDRYPALRQARHRPAASLSGGQQRIVEVGRLLVPDPDIVLVDEPSAGVAPAIAEVMYAELARMRAEGRTVILVDQDVRPALEIADTVYTVRSGRNDTHGPAAGFAATAVVREWLGEQSNPSSAERPGVPGPETVPPPGKEASS
jgi:branched-chain amino acid transport system ATP-binding protein